jgi:hypothetical protein
MCTRPTRKCAPLVVHFVPKRSALRWVYPYKVSFFSVLRIRARDFLGGAETVERVRSRRAPGTQPSWKCSPAAKHAARSSSSRIARPPERLCRLMPGRRAPQGLRAWSLLKGDELVNLHIVVSGAAIVSSRHNKLDCVLARSEFPRKKHVGVECIVVARAPMAVD